MDIIQATLVNPIKFEKVFIIIEVEAIKSSNTSNYPLAEDSKNRVPFACNCCIELLGFVSVSQ